MPSEVRALTGLYENTEHKFVTFYVINSAQNNFIYCSFHYFTLKKIDLLGLIILPGPGNTG